MYNVLIPIGVPFRFAKLSCIASQCPPPQITVVIGSVWAEEYTAYRYRARVGSASSELEFSEMLVSYLGVDSPAASSPGVLGASFSGYSGGRQRFVVDAGGWEVERVQMPGDGWRDAHDYIASTVFDLVSLAGISGTMEPRGIFSMAVPAEVLAAALAEDGSSRR